MAREQVKPGMQRQRRAERRHGICKTLKDPVVMFALICAVIVLIGAPLFGLSDVILAE